MSAGLEHWTANTGHCRRSSRAEVADDEAESLGKLLAIAGALGDPVGLSGPGDPWRLQVLAHPHGSRILHGRILAPDGLPVAVLAVGEDASPGAVRAWRDVVAATPWFEGAGIPDRIDPPEGPWLIGSLQPALALYPDATAWLADAERCIAWAFLEGLPRRAEA